MLSMLFALFAVVTSAVTQATDPVKVWMEGPVLMAMFDDGSFAAGVMEEGVLVVSTADTASPPQGGGGTAPSITTSYQDKTGATHTITTPVVSTTPAGLQAAKQTHQALVATMQALYPPKTT